MHDQPADITPEALRARLDRGESLAVLDVREPHERAYAAIPLPPTAADLYVPLNLLPVVADQLTITGSIMDTLKDMEDMARSRTNQGIAA